MSKFSQKGMEPYTCRHLTQWLTETYRPTLLPQSDHIWHAYELPGGSTVVIPGPSAANRPFATSNARKVAAELGMTYDEYRSALGHPLIKHSRPKPVVVRQEKPKGCSKGEVLTRLTDVRQSLQQLEVAVRTGAPRDSAVYAALHKSLSSALADTSNAVNQITRSGRIHA